MTFHRSILLSSHRHYVEHVNAIVRVLPKIQKEALAWVKLLPGATQGELAGLCGNRDSRHIGRRLPELLAKGLIRKGGLRKCTSSRRLSATWWPTA